MRVHHTRLALSLFAALSACDAAQDGSPDATAEPAQIAEYVVEAFEDRTGNLWFGTINKGVARFDGSTLTYLTEKDDLCGDTVTSMAQHVIPRRAGHLERDRP